ncbi:hypothetical protein FDP41_009960 [Naegleria fowleri]|uniref:Palmitoyl-protein thioesterase ABHD10, mitochondrial n=1 Tax=Naegleria fowleri TaxID=5763 RepID=A0A6A5AYU2_NAEFO|nr:uncharacterized protein FDP41_009960 [Naegleria fowleri]KAF0971737.1 hypothetical protein FDP41_009960 [Naegleria fowleri]CAG4713113.1 unnamed protein product [Naegleria fowleri]
MFISSLSEQIINNNNTMSIIHEQQQQIHYRYAFLHGFASAPSTRKGQHLKQFFAHQSPIAIELLIPDLNIPSFEELQVSLILKFLENRLVSNVQEKIDENHISNVKVKWRIIASSLGGFIATRFTELYPERVDALLLLAPAYDLAERWKNRFALQEWKSNGILSFYNYKEKCMKNVKYIFYQDLNENHPGFPIPHKLLIQLCKNTNQKDLKTNSPTLAIVHGKHDASVPLETTEEFIKRCNEAVPGSGDAIELHVVEDGHELTEPSTLSLLEKIISEKWLLKTQH